MLMNVIRMEMLLFKCCTEIMARDYELFNSGLSFARSVLHLNSFCLLRGCGKPLVIDKHERLQSGNRIQKFVWQHFLFNNKKLCRVFFFFL